VTKEEEEREEREEPLIRERCYMVESTVLAKLLSCLNKLPLRSPEEAGLFDEEARLLSRL
jgi:hypothetical protein